MASGKVPTTQSTVHRPLAPAARVYVGVVIVAGSAAIALSLPAAYPWTMTASVALAAMVAVSLFKLRLRVGQARATMTMAQFVDFWMIAEEGAGLATTIAVAGVLVQCLLKVRQPQPWYRTAFSAGAIALAVRAASYVWVVLGGVATDDVATSTFALGGGAVAYFLVNSGLVAGAVAQVTGEAPLACWRHRFLGAAPASLVAAAAVVAARHWFMPGFQSLAVLAVPIAICYAAYAHITSAG